MMGAHDVVAVLARLADHEIGVWVDGGWGIDALVGEQTRVHYDLDLVVAQDDCSSAQAALSGLDYVQDPRAEPNLPARVVLRGADRRQVDLHPVVFDARGDGWQPLGDNAWGAYPAAGLTGVGLIAGRRVRCIPPGPQLPHPLGSPVDESDRHDLRLLAERFGVGLPPGI